MFSEKQKQNRESGHSGYYVNAVWASVNASGLSLEQLIDNTEGRPENKEIAAAEARGVAWLLHDVSNAQHVWAEW